MIPNILYTSNGAITYRQGTDASISINVKNSAGDFIDMTGWSFRFVAKTDFNATSALIDLPSTKLILGNATVSNVVHTNAQLLIVFDDDCVKGRITDKSVDGVYQLLATDADGKKQIIMDGKFVVLKALV
jgi:hypothetical protein